MEVDGVVNEGKTLVESNDINSEMKLDARQSLRDEILDYLSKSKEAHFKSQQRGEPELEEAEKRSIAEEVLNRSKSIFLSRFGEHILEKHLDYFEICSDEERYEVDFYLQKLRGHKSTNKVRVRNRRFEALKQLVNKGKYFSEYEMKKRNPLLYDHLVGQFLSEDEERERTGIDTTNITFVNLLLEQYDRDQMKKLKKRQEEDEDNQREESDEEDSDADSCNQDEDMDSKSEFNEDHDPKIDKTSLWGETVSDCQKLNSDPSASSSSCSSKQQQSHEPTFASNWNEERLPKVLPDDMLTEEERQLLSEEFRSFMFNSFLEGKDDNFDYKEVDDNSDYDDMDATEMDEEEKYFNSESPEEVTENGVAETSDNCDEIDQCIANLRNEQDDNDLVRKMDGLNQCS
ncbi:hypothetical protein LSTR_LSTR002269 [Laodelphax striatellus]|uniref:CCD97-like C-terminal domain-containing protein n=1 Tax=Laodelphax striatellus TaxID=195883 RepID=A0A482XF46_LAOST|nr:hypothetical protein LSTR_LSTR002269 [Laodelphax striatellus]